MTKQDGLKLVDKLEHKLTKKEREERKKPLADARRYIENVEGGLDAKVAQSFRNSKSKTGVRIDLEIQSGTAFICLLIGLAILLFLLT